MKMKTCPDCNGDGVVDKDTDDERQCPTCGGLGFVADDDDDHEEVIKTSRGLPTADQTPEASHGKDYFVRIAIDPADAEH
jgi:DnaJ-class molecular chaperone